MQHIAVDAFSRIQPLVDQSCLVGVVHRQIVFDGSVVVGEDHFGGFTERPAVDVYFGRKLSQAVIPLVASNKFFCNV
jgi:hypothetical protein